MKISKHFKRERFACKCGCGFDTVDYQLIQALEDIREYYDKPVYINSGCRCISYNRSVGSKDTSQHTRGKAADFYIDGLSIKSISNYLNSKYPDTFGIGVYDDFIHLDVRDNEARWDNR